MTHPRILPHIRSLPATVPFIGPETLERKRGRPFAARLGANENGFGPAPSVIEAIVQAAPDVCQYGDPENHELKQALSAFYGIAPQNIAVDAGIDALLGLAVRLYVAAGDVVINTLGGYPTFNYHVNAYGGKLHTVPYRDNRADLAALAQAAIRHKARILYLANPDNPLGTWHNAGDIAAFLDSVPQDILVILDEAYCETAPPDTLLPLLPVRDNVIRMRTFSKAYGLAGLRCGYAIGPGPAIAASDRIRDHFSVNRLAQIAALAALDDRRYLAAAVAHIAKARARLCAIAAVHNLETLPSATNFVAIDCGGNGAYAQRVLEELTARDIFVRKPVVPVLDRLIRVSTGPDSCLDYFEKALGPALHAADR